MKPKLELEAAFKIAAETESTHSPLSGERSTAIMRSIIDAQHSSTLAWVRERLKAGEHLEDILAEE